MSAERDGVYLFLIKSETKKGAQEKGKFCEEVLKSSGRKKKERPDCENDTINVFLSKRKTSKFFFVPYKKKK